jgi:hypothetical protein
VVIVACHGWNDAGEAATGALHFLAQCYDAQSVYELDDELFWDYTATRPQVEGQETERQIIWPSIRFATARTANQDLLLVDGPEPNLMWRTFTRIVVEKITEAKPALVVVLGSMLADVPHTRGLPINGSSTSPEIDVMLARSDYEGPTGIIGILADACRGIPDCEVVNLWVSVPHYAASNENPLAVHTLLTQVRALLGNPADLDLSKLETDARDWVRRVSQLVDDDPEISEYVEELERGWDSDDISTVTGETIAQEFERFLRDPGR